MHYILQIFWERSFFFLHFVFQKTYLRTSEHSKHCECNASPLSNKHLPIEQRFTTVKKKWSLPNALKCNWPLGLASSPELFIRCWYCGINTASGWIHIIKFTVVKLIVLSNSSCLISCTSELNLTFVTHLNHIALPATKNAQLHPECYEHPSRWSIQFSGIMLDSYGQRYSFLDVH